MLRGLRGSGRILLAVGLIAAPVWAYPQSGPGEGTNQVQQQGADAQLTPAAQAKTGVRATVHGVVKNAATGEPLPRALVRIEGDASSGALTDGDGRFEIPGVPIGPQAFQVIKPGFRDQIAMPGMFEKIVNVQRTLSEHNVMVAAEMPDLVFTMAPSNSIRGQIELSTGDPAQGIGVMLLRRAVQDGRAVWQTATNARTNSEGVYRFAGLSDGVYAVYTEPAMDSDQAANMVKAGSDAQVARSGYATLFYPEAHDLAGAAKIELSGGQQTQANFTLPLEPFQMVRATVSLPGSGQTTAAERGAISYTATVTDAEGHPLPYSAQYDQATRTLQALLPNGTYSLLVTAVSSRAVVRFGPGRDTNADFAGAEPSTGRADFAVAGHPVVNLRIPLAVQRSNPIQVSVLRSGARPSTANYAQGEGIYVTVSQAGGSITDGMVSTFAQGSVAGLLETGFMAPGPYWVRTSISQGGLCQASFTAGGASLAHEPLMLGLSGATAPMTLTLRDDCAALKLSLPGSVGVPIGGEEPYYTIYVVPDFDSTADLTPLTLRPSTGGTLTLDNLTPGNYHVYTFAAPLELEYRNPEALAGLPGQALTLSPGETGNLVVEVSGH